MSLLIHPGYMGYAYVQGNALRCTDFSVNVKQEPIFYDHIIGLRDGIPQNIYDVKGDIDAHNKQKMFWRPGVKISQGSLGFPWTENNLGNLLYEAVYGSNIPSLTMYYTCGFGRIFTDARVNSYTLRMANGDFVSSTVDIMAKHIGVSGGTPAPLIRSEKLVTWDTVSITSGLLVDELVSFEFTINNGCMPIYTAGNNSLASLEPKEIRVGMQSVTGIVSYYTADSLVFLETSNTPTTIAIDIDGYSINLNVIFKPMEQTAAISPVIRTVQFVGVDHGVSL